MNLSDVHDQDKPEITFIGFIKEVFSFLLSKTDLLAYCIVCSAQVSTSSVLTLPMSMLVYLWGTLTVPRPSRTFWVLLIGYTQIVVIIKSIAHFKIFWWEENNWFIKLLGIQPNNMFTIFELLLIVVVSFHRAVLKMLGLWQSTECKFQAGEYCIESCDENTSLLIEKCFSESRIMEKEKSDVKIGSLNSMDELIIDEDKEKSKVLVKHELSADKLRVQAVYEDRKKILEAEEHVEYDNQGGLLINLQQGKTKITLRQIDLSDVAKTYDTRKLIIVEEMIEEPFEFLPSTILMSIAYHFYITRNFLEFFKPKRASKRVDVYKFMFFCDFINFFVLLIGFKEFAVSLRS